MKKINYKKYLFSLAVFAVMAVLVTALPVFAQDNNKPNVNGQNSVPDFKGFGLGLGVGHGKGTAKSAVIGTVSAVSGNTITVTSKQRKVGLGIGKNKPEAGVSSTTTTPPAIVTYTVDATNSKIMKNGVAGTISSILVGDVVIAQGKITGTNVVATTIRDGQMMNRPEQQGQGDTSTPSQGLSQIIGNGQPLVIGKVVSVSGSTINITNNSNVNYSVDTTSAKIIQGSNDSATISDINVGDMVIIQGTISGNSVAASTVIDRAAKPAGENSGVNSQNGPNPQASHPGIFGKVGQFLSHMFGF